MPEDLGGDAVALGRIIAPPAESYHPRIAIAQEDYAGCRKQYGDPGIAPLELTSHRMQKIPAESVPLAVAGYATAAEAIRASKQDNLSWIAKTGIASCFGQKISDASWTPGRVLIQFVSGDVICVSCDEDGVICGVLDSPSGSRLNDAGGESSIVELLFRNTSIRWDRDRLISGLRGKTLSRIQMSGRVLFLYASELPIICFGAMRNRDTGELFLYWDESD